MEADFKTAIEKSQKLLKEDLDSVNRKIIELIKSDVPVISEMSKYLIAAGGKRIRVLLTLLSSNLFGYQGNKDILLATCVEFIHTATLLHDDVIDENDNRRGLATPNSLWGNKSAVLVGDFLFSRAFELMVQTNNMEILAVLSNASSIIAEGEVLQLCAINDIELSVEQYLEIIQSKTSALFSAATKVGAILSCTSEDNIVAISNYAQFLGSAFQVIDDVLDYSGDKKEIGKNIGTDMYEGKITLPIILCLKECNNEETSFLTKIFKNLQIKDGDLEIVIKLLNKYNSINKSMYYANDFVEKALNSLVKINIENKYKQSLQELALSSLNRKY